MSSEQQVNVYLSGEMCPSIYGMGDIVFQTSRTKVSKNMDILWRHFHKTQNYPEYYLGFAEKMAVCKCPVTGAEEWYNPSRCLTIQDPVPGQTVMVTMQKNGQPFGKEWIFLRWRIGRVHEWKTQKQTFLQLEEDFVAGLFHAEKRQLKINR
jgi:hypothetical protein